MKRDVTVVIPGIPERIHTTLQRALDSVWAQTHLPEMISVGIDWAKEGAGANRQRLLDRVTTTWVAFLDDDDELMPHHLQRLLDVAEETKAHVIVPWFKVQGGLDPFPQNRACGVPPIGEGMPAFPVTVLALADWARTRQFPVLDTISGGGEEYHYFTRLRDSGAQFVMIPDETWIYHHNGKNTSGLARNRK